MGDTWDPPALAGIPLIKGDLVIGADCGLWLGLITKQVALMAVFPPFIRGGRGDPPWGVVAKKSASHGLA
jgi:hypothetical protein